MNLESLTVIIGMIQVGYGHCSVSFILMLQLLQLRAEEVLIESTGVIGRRIKKVISHSVCMSLLLSFSSLSSSYKYISILLA